jgi:colicin import membrane protein
MKFLKLENNDELQANLFSFAIHLALFLVMIFSVGWQTKTPYYGEVELWDSVPVQKKINKTQATPKKKIKQKQNTKARNLLKQKQKQKQRLKRKRI